MTSKWIFAALLFSGEDHGVFVNPTVPILRHRGEAGRASDRFLALSLAQKQQLFTFLNSL